MLISEFVRETGLSKDTVRFYVRLGLLAPETNGKGGRNPYQIFTQEHVRVVALIRLAQSLGMSLKEIAVIGEEYARGGGISPTRSVEILSTQLSRLEQKATEIDSMAANMRAKLAWLKSAGPGPEPDVGDYITHAVPVACIENNVRSTGTSRPKPRSAAR